MLLNNIQRIKEKRKRTIISILGVDTSVGTTHTSIMLAEYLSHTQGKSVIVLEVTSKRDFAKIQRIYEMSEDIQTLDKRFVINKVTYMREVFVNEIANILNESFDYFILDLGSDYTNLKSECLRSDIKLVIGSLIEWRREGILKFIEENKKNDNIIDFLYLIIFGDKKEIKYLNRQNNIKAYSVPYTPDPFRLGEEVKILFNKLI